MQQEVSFELNLSRQDIKQQILGIFQEIKDGCLVESKYILEDLNPLISQLSDSDKKEVVMALNTYFIDYEFVKQGGYFLKENFSKRKVIDYQEVYNQDRKNHNYESILDKLKMAEYRRKNKIPDEFAANLSQLTKLKIKSLLVFDLLDYYLDNKDLSQIEILKILLELFYCNSIFTDDESKTFEQLIGSLLQQQLYEISYYFENLQKDDPHNYLTFVEYVKNLQLTITPESDNNLQTFLKKNQRYKVLLMNFSKDILNIRSNLQSFISSLIQIPPEKCQFAQVISYVNNIENVNDNLNDLYVQIVFYYWKKYCLKYNLQADLKTQLESLPNLFQNERKLKFIERYLIKQKSNFQDKIYLFVIQRICYFIEDINDIISKDIYLSFTKKMDDNFKVYQEKKQILTQIILIDYRKLLEYWKIIRSLRFYKSEILKQNDELVHLITNFFWIYNQDINLFNILQIITQNKESSFLEAVSAIAKEINQLINDSKTNLDFLNLFQNFLRIIYSQFPNEEYNYLLLKKLLENYGSLLRASMVLEANKFLSKTLDQKSISFFSKLGTRYIVLHKIFPDSTLSKLAQELLNYLKSEVEIYECLLSLKYIFRIKQIALSEDLQSIRILIRNFSTNILGYLIMVNKSQNTSLTAVKWTTYAIFQLFQKIDLSQFQKVEKCIEQLFKDQCYNFQFVFHCLKHKINFQKINKIVQLQYYLCRNLENKLFQLSEELFQQDEQLYEEWFRIKKPTQMMLSIEYLKIKKSQQYYPKQMDIPLEDFNISLSEQCEQKQKQVFENWIQDMANAQKFKLILPLLYNIIKRGESPRDVLISANQSLQKNRQLADRIGYFNLKSLFQIFFNNANDELKLILMKFFSKEFPIPFLYQNPVLDKLKLKTELLLLNSNLFYFFDQGYTIINLSLSENQKKIGKTELINDIFYEREKFETSDTCRMNSNTIDIMFDFEFNNSRNFILADVHGKIIFEILIKILPFFKFWIVQMDSLRELQENLDQLRNILKQIDQQLKYFLQICIIVRNTEEKDEINKLPRTFDLEGKNIQIIYIHNLVANQIDKQFKISQTQDVSKFLFKQIVDHQKTIESKNLKPQNLKDQFLLLLKQFNSQYANNIQQIHNHNSVMNKIQEQLNLIVNSQDGFYSQDAFPIRRILWNIKKLKQQNYELIKKPQENKYEIDQNKQKMKDLEKTINEQNATDLLKLFCAIFDLRHYYIVYLWIVDKIREFNEKNLIYLQKNEYQLNEQFKTLKQEKKQIKQKYLNNLEKLCQDPRNKEIKSLMSQLKQKMSNNRLNISQKNVGIELFWRELISLIKSKHCLLDFDPVQILSQLIRKGESLEFLDGDTLSIDTKFLFDLANKITQNKQQKILVISILGPQSSGKSTILNKIFGCHFWASIGRCTKGIHLQILQVENKELFQNRFDQILILDTEGLQNPNQNDPEFDKKIALFVLSISDIIIINVKGEINQQFKSLVEMCILTLGHLKNGLSMCKQLSWFFNQNDNYKNVEPFRQQIKDLAQNINVQWNENYSEQQVGSIDYADILDIKDNISGLGFASDQKDWGKNGWNQSVNNHTFSKEAYKQGVNMIKQFLSKLQGQKDSLNDFNHFLQNVQRNWESIEKLPDLLEFSELIQHSQNLMMKKYFDDLWRMEDTTQIGEKLIEETKSQIESQQYIVFDFYKQIKQEKEKEIEYTNQQFKIKLQEQMETFIGENKIQKKIVQKYLKKLENLIEALGEECKLKLLNLILKYEEVYQQKKGYVLIDNFIQEVLNDEIKRKKFQGNNQEIESEFKKKWEEFIRETEIQSQSQYLEMISAYYKALKSISNKYILRTKNEKQYITYLSEVIIKQNPNNQQDQEQEEIFELFKQEFLETEQFIFMNKTQANLAYLDIFQQKIEEKLEKSKDQLLNMRQFYSQDIIYQVVEKQDIQNYLQTQFQNDFQNYIKKYENQRNLKNYYLNFLSLLYYLQINYDEKLKQQLDCIMNNPSSWQQVKLLFTSKSTQVSDAFSELKQSLKFQNNENLKLDFSGKQFGQTFSEAYKSLKVLKIVDSSSNDSQQFRNKLFQQYIIIDTEIEIKPSENQFYEVFNCITSPKDTMPENFRKNFPKQFNSIMRDQNGWKMLYKELYVLIKEEIDYQKYGPPDQQGNQNNNEDETISSFNPYIITSIIQKVENNIKIKYNNQFAQYGLILTDVGERCIFYYSMLIIWRFLCYQRWNSKNIQQQHQNNYQTELIRCKAEINQDNQKQSCIKATELVSKIQISLKNQFLNRTKKEVLQQMNQVSMSSADLISKLDKELLIDVNTKMFEDQTFKKKILSYTTDHKSFINQYTFDMLKQVQDKLLTDYSNKYKKELSLYLQSIQQNAKIFFKYIKNQQKEVKTIKYFVEDAKQQDKIFYENYLFRLLIQCLLGKIEDKIDIIEKQYTEIFQVSNYNPVNYQLKINLQLLNQQDQQVYNLKSFVETLIEEINLILKNIDQIQFKQAEYQLDVEFGKLKLQMNGCEYTCPCCKRKCDEDNDNDSNHIHKCQNGHQIRGKVITYLGINGILISHNSPSLFTCEEILDQCILITLETNLQKTWKEVKKAHSNWNFKNIYDAKNNENKEKWEKVWNIGLGRLICLHLEKQLNHQIILSQKSSFEIYISNIHYILILDDSGSMQGEKWDNAKNGALHCIKSLENADSAKVSVIIFNGDARIVVECQKPNYSQISSCISYKGGNTAFDPPFKMALQLIEKHKGFNKIQILFYTDGEAGYPQATIDQFFQLPPQIRSRISLTACSGEKSSHSLQQMIEKFSQHMQLAQLKNSVQPMEIQKVWTEVVSKNIHSQLV